MQGQGIMMITDRGGPGNHVVPHDGDAARLVAVLAEKFLKGLEHGIAGLGTLDGIDFDVEGIVWHRIQEKSMGLPKTDGSQVCFFRRFGG